MNDVLHRFYVKDTFYNYFVVISRFVQDVSSEHNKVFSFLSSVVKCLDLCVNIVLKKVFF